METTVVLNNFTKEILTFFIDVKNDLIHGYKIQEFKLILWF